MKLIELLNKLENGEVVPYKIKIFNDEFNFDGDGYYSEHSSAPLTSYMGEDYLVEELKKEIEIIEDKKIKKLDLKYDDIIYHDDVFFKKEILLYCDNLQDKINEIIDKMED